MWTVIKIEKNNIEFLKRELQKKLNNELSFYIPKFFSEKYFKNKLMRKELLDEFAQVLVDFDQKYTIVHSY